MPLRYVSPTGQFNRSAIVRAAWAAARRHAATLATMPGALRRLTTARAEFGGCLRSIWGQARDERELVLWNLAEADRAAAEAARLATLTVRERQIEAAEHALMLAEHSDAFTSFAPIAAAQARLAALRAAA